MTDYIVTVKLPKHPLHDPTNKQSGKCPIDKKSHCTDTTGAHHSTLVRTEASIAEVRAQFEAQNVHVTRIESVWGE